MEKKFGDVFVSSMRVALNTLRKTLNLTELTAAAVPGLGDMGTGVAISDADLQSLIASWSREVDDTLGPLLLDDYHHGAQGIAASTAGAFGIDAAPSVTSDQTLHHLQQARNRMINFADSLWEDVRAELSDGVRHGESTDQLAARVTQVGSVAEPRALVVARTEVHTAVETGANDQMQMFGFNDDDTVKVWESTHDGRTRMTHADADGQRVALSQVFNVGGSSLMYPGDPGGPAGEVINCRCTTVYDVTDKPKSQALSPPQGAETDSVGSRLTGSDALESVPARMGRRTKTSVPLTPKQQAAARQYQSTYFVAINGQLRRDELNAKVSGIVEQLDAVMQSSRLAQPIETWRGMTAAGRLFGDALRYDMTGVRWSEKAYTSTSTLESVARSFLYSDDATDVLMRVVVPRNVGAMRISGEYEQAEVLLERGLDFRVVADHGVSPAGYRLLDVEVIK